MPITIKKDEFGIKFFGSNPEPITIIYDGNKTALLNYGFIDNQKLAAEIAEAVIITGIFVNCLNAIEDNLKRNNIDVMYINETTLDAHNTKYSAKKVLSWLESDKIVTVNKRDRIRYQFTKFAFQGNKLVILYKPVAW